MHVIFVISYSSMFFLIYFRPNQQSNLRENNMVSIISFILPLLLLASLANTKSKCDWSGSNCKISAQANENWAVKCTATWILGMFADKCYGEEVPCAIPGSTYCKNPDKSFLSCLQGKGDCRGYDHQTTASKQGCECDYFQPNGIFRAGGCRIVNPSPANHGCYCHYTLWTCYGTVGLCKNYNNHKCKHSDDTLSSCEQGGGDCGGYLEYQNRFL